MAVNVGRLSVVSSRISVVTKYFSSHSVALSCISYYQLFITPEVIATPDNLGRGLEIIYGTGSTGE